jgi:transcriptional regulator of acetoin/glycerol metabolism
MQPLEQGSHEHKPRPKREGEGDIVPLHEVEKRAIIHALMQLKGNKPEVARRLGIGKSTLYRKLKRYGVQQ